MQTIELFTDCALQLNRVTSRWLTFFKERLENYKKVVIPNTDVFIFNPALETETFLPSATKGRTARLSLRCALIFHDIQQSCSLYNFIGLLWCSAASPTRCLTLPWGCAKLLPSHGVHLLLHDRVHLHDPKQIHHVFLKTFSNVLDSYVIHSFLVLKEHESSVQDLLPPLRRARWSIIFEDIRFDASTMFSQRQLGRCWFGCKLVQSTSIEHE